MPTKMIMYLIGRSRDFKILLFNEIFLEVKLKALLKRNVKIKEIKINKSTVIKEKPTVVKSIIKKCKAKAIYSFLFPKINLIFL